MRRGRKLRSKNIRACSAVGRPAASAWRQTCLRAKYIGRVSLLERMVRSKGRQLVTKVAKAAAWSSVAHPPSAFQAMGSSAELGSFSGSGGGFDTSTDSSE